MSTSTQKSLQTLKKHWGHSSFRGLQEQALQQILNGQNLLAVMPTGMGKSLLYQLPMVQTGKKALVISPLIALMDDQALSLYHKGFEAYAWHSMISESESRKIYLKIKHKELQFLFVSPERALTLVKNGTLSKNHFDLLVIDEAHCISQWGHDFRQDYRRLLEVQKRLDCQILTLTATATPMVRLDILKNLKMPETPILVSGFSRENLSFQAIFKKTHDSKLKALYEELELLGFRSKNETGRVIVYAATQSFSDKVGKYLNSFNFPCTIYHGGMTAEARSRSHSLFQQGKKRIMIATSAFGMGIDLPDIRLVFHIQTPGSLSAYYQEAGRAGRDGLKSRCVLCYSYGDTVIQEMLIRRSGSQGKVLEHQLKDLKVMTEYSQDFVCRQKKILDYFGEKSENCGRCDICLEGQPSDIPPPPIHHEFNQQDKADVIEACKTMPGLMGKIRWIQVFRGKKVSGKSQYPWEDLNFYGRFAYLSQDQLKSGLENLLDSGDLSVYGSKYPRLTVPGYKKSSFRRVFFPDAPDLKVNPGHKSPRSETARLLKNFIAREARAKRLKPFMVLTKASIKAICEDLPETLEDLSKISGIGPKKIDWIGPQIIQIVLENLNLNDWEGL